MMARSVFAYWRKTFLVLAWTGVCIFSLPSGFAVAQEIDQDLLERLRQERGLQPQQRRSPLDTARQGAVDPQQTPGPSASRLESSPAPEVSPLEKDYRDRLGQVPESKKRAVITETGDIITIEEEIFEGIEQYGYDIFVDPETSQFNGIGRISDDYLLGIGDQIVITMVGAKSDAFISQIDREGRFVMPDLPPIAAAGVRLGDFRQLVKTAAAETIVGTDVYVSVGSVRQVGIYVMGEVANPGFYTLTAMSSVFDALNAAGGIKKTGSLRRISLVQDEASKNVDLYKFIMGGNSANIKISDGARVSVPVIGENFAVAGSVLRSGIYEFAPGKNQSSIQQLIESAGGMIRPRGNRIVLNRILENGQMSISAVEDVSANAMAGDLLEVVPGSNYQTGRILLSGHVSVEGPRSLDIYPSISKLVGSEADLGPTPYLSLAVLITTNKESRARVYVPVNLQLIMNGHQDVELGDNDELVVFSEQDVRFLSSAVLRDTVFKREIAEDNKCEAIAYLFEKAGQSESQRFDIIRRTFFETSSPRREINETAEIDPRSPIDLDPFLSDPEDKVCPAVFQARPEILVFALENSLGITGGVRFPGIYPVADRASVESLLATAGGSLPDADLSNIEVTLQDIGSAPGSDTAQRILVAANSDQFGMALVPVGSTVRVNSIPSLQEPGGILLTGEFERPGIYSIRRGETLVELIDRAGGLTEQAYPYGAVMTRLSVKEEQEEGFRRTAREINAALASAAVKNDLSAEAAIAVRDLATELATVEALGRLVIEADPAALRARPDLNILLEAGDRLHMPKRPQFVVVTGDVLNPGALQFTAGKNVKQFLKEAGGLSKSADDDRVFLIYPNGSATPIKTALWSFKSYAVPPGSTIVVPKNLSPFTTLEVIRDVTSIFSQLALAAASIAVIADRR